MVRHHFTMLDFDQVSAGFVRSGRSLHTHHDHRTFCHRDEKFSLSHLIFLILVALIFPFSFFFFKFFLLNHGCLAQEQRRLAPWRIFLRLRAVSLHHSFSFKSNPKQASGEAVSRDKPWA